MTLYHTSIRVSELCDLRASDGETSERKGMLTVRAGNGMKQRIVPLTTDVRKAIARHPAERQSPDPDDFRFISRHTGGGLTSKAVRDLAAKFGYQALVEDAHLHAFRHSFAT